MHKKEKNPFEAKMRSLTKAGNKSLRTVRIKLNKLKKKRV